MKYVFNFFKVYGKYFFPTMGFLSVSVGIYLSFSQEAFFFRFYFFMIGLFILAVDALPGPKPDETQGKKIRVICDDAVWHLQYKVTSAGYEVWVDYAKSETEQGLQEKLEELKNKIYNPENGTKRYY